MAFQLDERLATDTLPVLTLELCVLLLMNDSRWPWLLLVPKRENITELYELAPRDQAMLTLETARVSKTLAEISKCRKINIGALGNVVPQFHMHIVARNESDTNWPRPVWGFAGKVPYSASDAGHYIDQLRAAF